MGTGGVRGEKVALKAKDVLAREREKKKEIKRLLWKDACAFFAPIYSSRNLVYGTSFVSFPPCASSALKKIVYKILDLLKF